MNELIDALMRVPSTDRDSIAIGACARAPTRPRVEGEGLADDPIEFFPFGIAEYLADCKAQGMTFDEAWNGKGFEHAAMRRGFTFRNARDGQVESSLHFARRVLRDAYEGRPPTPYCERDCSNLAVAEGLCADHLQEEGEEAA